MKRLALVLTLIASTSAGADELTAGDLYSFCRSKVQVSQTACRFYILGVVQGIELGDGSAMGDNRRFVEKQKTLFCAPDDMPQSQMINIFQKQMQLLEKTFPDDLKLPAHSLIAAAMSKAFPCK